MKKFILLYLLVLGLSVEGANYNNMKDLIFDGNNAVGKTINIKGVVRRFNSSLDWNYQRRPSMGVKDIGDNKNNRGKYLDIFFNNRLKKEVKKLNVGQIINVTCRIKEIGILIRCDLIKFNLVHQ